MVGAPALYSRMKLFAYSPVWMFFNEESRKAMRQALKNIQTGEYAKSFTLEYKAGAPTMVSRRHLTEQHQIEQVGGKLRAMMPWIGKNKLVDQSKN